MTDPNPILDPCRPEPGRVARLQAAEATGWSRWLPGLQLLRGYQADWLRHDIAAGLVLTTMLVPVGIAYAVASGLPGIYGLYATIVPLLAYALFGPSRILVLGPDSSLAAVILAVVLPLSGGDPARAIALASAPAGDDGIKLVLIRDGSLLDEDSMELVAGLADEAGALAIVERVGTRDPGAIIIVDGGTV